MGSHAKAAAASAFRRTAFLAILVFCSAGWLSADSAAPTLESVQTRLAAMPVLRGSFQNDRMVTGLQRPLRSTGRFLLVRERGLIWTQEAPFAQEFTVTRTFLRQGGPGSPARTISAGENPAAAIMGEFLIAIFSGNMLVASPDFLVRFEPVSSVQWQLLIKPQRAPMSEMFRTIRVTGAQWIEQVELANPQGDRTVVKFLDLRTTPAELSDAEEAAFWP